MAVTRRNRHKKALFSQSQTGKGLLIAGVLICGVLVFSFFFDDMGISKYMDMWQKAQTLKQDIFSLERENAGLRRDIFRLKHDSARVEELAREQLGLVRKGETVYQLVDPRPSISTSE